MFLERVLAGLVALLLSSPYLLAATELDDYRTALRLWAAGELDSAIESTLSLEDRAIDGGPGVANRLLTAQKSTVELLDREDREVLVVVALLHIAAWEHDGRSGDLRRLSRHRAIAILATETLAESKPAEASWLFTRLSQATFAYGGAAGARPLLDRAIELDPGNRPAYLGLGFLEERDGRRPEAVRNYARAARSQAEARLRLAVCLIRLGRSGDAQPILLDLAQQSSGTWLATVAWQELGRSYLALGDYVGAREVLETASTAVPDPRIQIMLAYALERTGESEQARRLMDRPRAGSDQPAVDPRDRYNQPPGLALDPLASARIESWVSGLRVRLEAVLDRSEPGP